jgi:hypothetical protein
VGPQSLLILVGALLVLLGLAGGGLAIKEVILPGVTGRLQRLCAGGLGLILIGIGVYLMIVPADGAEGTAASSAVPQPTASPIRNPTAPSGPDETTLKPRPPGASPSASRSQVCKSYAQALIKEAAAVNAVNAQVKTDGHRPVGIRSPAYEEDSAKEESVNARALQAWGAYANLGIAPPTNQVIPTILSDIADFIRRLPAELGDRKAAAADWDALQDRPKVLSEDVAPAVSRQCSSL